MEFRGKVFKTEDKPSWVIEAPSLGVITQGHTKKEAISMLQDALETLIISYFDVNAKVKVRDYGKGSLGITSTSRKLLLSLALIKQREASGMSIRDVSRRLGSNTPNAYARYEKGTINISIEKFDELLKAVNPNISGLMLSLETVNPRNSQHL